MERGWVKRYGMDTKTPGARSGHRRSFLVSSFTPFLGNCYLGFPFALCVIYGDAGRAMHGVGKGPLQKLKQVKYGVSVGVCVRDLRLSFF